MEDKLLDVQGLMLDLIQFTSFNGFDGPKVRQGLEWRRNYWEACFMTRVNPGIILRDLSEGIYNVDTLYILPAPGRDLELEKLAKSWNPGTIKWIEGTEAEQFLGQYGKNKRAVLEVWWD